MGTNSKVTITERQRSWLLGQAKREQYSVSCVGTIYMEKCFYKITQCRTHISGKVIQNKYNIEKMFTIKFKTYPFLTEVGNIYDLERIERDGYTFEIITPQVHK